LERAQTLKNIEDGKIDLLYLAPESLRNKNIQKVLQTRKISHFVIDEAHCFSKR
jgi:ATP-dependent DNA helicase RecQ